MKVIVKEQWNLSLVDCNEKQDRVVKIDSYFWLDAKVTRDFFEPITKRSYVASMQISELPSTHK